MNIEKILKTLSEKRPVFHSEADFQHALAWEIHLHYPNAKIRLEYPVGNETIHIDIYVTLGKKVYAIELKYKTKTTEPVIEYENEGFPLKNQGAQDLGRYDFVKDINRLEILKREILNGNNNNFDGYSIFLTNDHLYWGKPTTNRNTIDKQFRIHCGNELTGTRSWIGNPAEGTIKNKENPIILTGTYKLEWQLYHDFENVKNGKFKYLIVKI